MPPASKSKSKDKSSRAAKEYTKVSLKPVPAPASVGAGVSASAYNPLSGTFHTFDTTTSGLLPETQYNVLFRTIGETDENSGSSSGTAGEFDSSSNNDSCSGESEDQKEKITGISASRLEPVPGSDTDKREKTRQKNERKHQRQKERRTQELHERCSGYLMSRKLEVLAQQLMAMGFSSEQSTMALIQNEGHLEESVTWLFDGSEDNKQQVNTDIEGGVNLKIDITEELAKISEMEAKLKCTKQEVERAVVTCEGDLDKAENLLKLQRREHGAPLKLEEPGDPLALGNFTNNIAQAVQTSVSRNQPKGLTTLGILQQRKDEQEFSYPKPNAHGIMSLESINRSLQSLNRTQPRQQVAAAADRRWSIANSPPSSSYPLSSLSQAEAPLSKSEARYMMASNNGKANLQAGMLREPIVMMQRPQSINAKQSMPSTSLTTNSSPPTSAGWYSNGAPSMDLLKVANGSFGHGLLSMNFNGSNGQHFSQQNHFQQFVSGQGHSRNLTTQTSSESAPSSFGSSFTGWGSMNSTALYGDWSSVGSGPIDYTSIDWSLDRALLRPSAKNDRLSHTWSTMFMGGKAIKPSVNASLAVDPSATAGSHEWTSPFAGKDIFRVPRQFVTSPNLLERSH